MSDATGTEAGFTTLTVKAVEPLTADSVAITFDVPPPLTDTFRFNPGQHLTLRRVEGDHLAVVSENRKLLVFALSELPEMARGKGVRLQRYKDGGLADAKVFAKKDGLTYIDTAGRSFVLTELRDWWGARAQAGRLPPKGFPKSGKFGARF